jgi:hypothetical protein
LSRTAPKKPHQFDGAAEVELNSFDCLSSSTCPLDGRDEEVRVARLDLAETWMTMTARLAVHAAYRPDMACPYLYGPTRLKGGVKIWKF